MEIHRDMWVRNGLQIKGQAMTYIQCHFCYSMVDADIYLMQVMPQIGKSKAGLFLFSLKIAVFSIQYRGFWLTDFDILHNHSFRSIH